MPMVFRSLFMKGCAITRFWHLPHKKIVAEGEGRILSISLGWFKNPWILFRIWIPTHTLIYQNANLSMQNLYNIVYGTCMACTQYIENINIGRKFWVFPRSKKIYIYMNFNNEI